MFRNFSIFVCCFLILVCGSVVFAQDDTFEVTLEIDVVLCEDAQEDRVVDVAPRGDEIYIVYTLSEIGSRGRVVNTVIGMSEVHTHIGDGDSIVSTSFDPVTLEIDRDNGLEVSVAVMEADADVEQAEEYVEEFRANLEEFNDAHNYESGSEAQGATALDFLELALDSASVAYDILREDDQLGVDVQQYEERDIREWGDSGVSSSFHFSNQGMGTGNEYIVDYWLHAE